MEDVLLFVERWESWIYPGLALYAALKSGLLPIFAGVLAAAGMLDVSLVFGALLGGTVVGEEAKYWLGKRFGASMRTRWVWLDKAVPRVEAMTARWGQIWLLLYRWPKGGRTLGAFPIGLAGWSWFRFGPLNLLGSVLWAAPLVAIGYTSGPMLLSLLERYGGAVTAGMLAITVVLVWFAWHRSGPAKLDKFPA